MEKINEIKQIEKEAKGIVSINFDEKPKRKAIQNIKPKKKVHYKPFVSAIQEEKVIVSAEGKEKQGMSSMAIKIEDLQKEIDNQKKALELKIKEAQAEKIKLLKEEKAKKKAERKERRRKHWYFRIFMKKVKVPEVKEIYQNYQNPNEIKLIELDYQNLKKCPLCNAKIKKTNVKQDFNILRQNFKCKKCDFQKEIAIKL